MGTNVLKQVSLINYVLALILGAAPLEAIVETTPEIHFPLEVEFSVGVEIDKTRHDYLKVLTRRCFGHRLASFNQYIGFLGGRLEYSNGSIANLESFVAGLVGQIIAIT